MTAFTSIPSPVGDLLAVDHGDGLAGLYFDGHRGGPQVGEHWRRDAAAFTGLRQQLGDYFAGRRDRFEVVLAPVGSPFQRRVWAALADIPFGSTVTYGRLAAEVGHPGSARAVGAAVARNPLSIVVPCHRVMGARGTLTGYAGGIERKRRLLALEGVAVVA